jgi:two-component system response regulator HydG
MRPLRIFLVDDNQDFAESLADILRYEGYRVELAFDAESAVQKFREQEFDITFMDVKLPGMNGVEGFFEIRKVNPQARVVMMSAYSVEQLLAQAIDHGALGMLRKPFDTRQLLALLEDIKPEGVILMADDDGDFVASVQNLLVEQGYAVIVAHTGQEAVDVILADGIDILILDLRLPILSGLEVYLTLKKHGRVLPTIIVTGYAAEEADAINQLRSMSIVGCLIKPFDPQELLELVRAIQDEASRR